MQTINKEIKLFAISQEKLEKGYVQIEKIEILLEKMIIKYTQLSSNINNSQLEFFSNLKNFSALFSLCLLEITETFSDMGLEYLNSPLTKLFQFYKISTINFIKQTNEYCKKKLTDREEEFKIENNDQKKKFFDDHFQEFIDYLKEYKNVKKNPIKAIQGNKYERMEKLRFILEQEGYEIDDLLSQIQYGKNEIEKFFLTKVDLKKIHTSGAIKILESIKFKHLNPDNVKNYDDLLKFIDKRFEKELENSQNNKDIIHEITKNIITKLQKAQTKKKKDRKYFDSDYYSPSKRLELEGLSEDKETQVDFDDLVMNRTKSIAIRNLMKSKENEQIKDLENYNDEVLRKARNLELQKNELNKEISSLNLTIKQKDFLIKKKKQKIQNHKILITELKDKLSEFAEKDSINQTTIKIKESELQNLKIIKQEQEDQHLIQLKEMNYKTEILEKKFKLSIYEKRKTSKRLSNNEIQSIDEKEENKIISDYQKKSPKTSLKKKNKIDSNLKFQSPLQRTQTTNLQTRKRASTFDPALSKLNILNKIKNKKKDDLINDFKNDTIDNMKRSGSLGFDQKSNFLNMNSEKINCIDEKEEDDFMKRSMSVCVGKSGFSNKLTLKAIDKQEELSEFETNELISYRNEGEFEINDNYTIDNELFNNQENYIENNNDNKIENENLISEKEIKDNKFVNNARVTQLKMFYQNKIDENVDKIKNLTESNLKIILQLFEKSFANRYNNKFFLKLEDFLKTNGQKFDKSVQTIIKYYNNQSIQTNTIEKSIIIYNQINSPEKKYKNLLNNKEIHEKSLKNTENNEYINPSKLNFIKEKKPENTIINEIYKNSSNLNFIKKRTASFHNEKIQTEIKNIKKFDLPIKINYEPKYKLEENLKNSYNDDIESKLFNLISYKKKNDENLQRPGTEISKKKKNFANFEKESLTQRNFFESPRIREIFYMKKNTENDFLSLIEGNLNENEKNDDINYAKFKSFYKYPFKSLHEQNNEQINNNINQLIREFINKHHKCGKNCIHLQRFYQKIGVLGENNFRKEFHIKKKIIDKIIL